MGAGKLFRILTVLAFAAFAAPVVASGGGDDDDGPQKKFTIDVSPAIVAAIQQYTVVIKNQTPNGTSSINSLKVQLPAGYKVDTVDPGTAPASANWVGTISAPNGASIVSMKNMSPLKVNQSFTLTFWAKTTAVACSTSTWTAQAWSGSNFNGSSFRQVVAPELPVNTKTTAPGTKSTTIGVLPTNPVAGTSFPVTVTLADSCGTPVPPTSVVLSGGPSLTSNSPQTTIGGVATFSASFGSAGPATLTANGGAFGSDTDPLTIWGGTLACGSGEGGFDFPPAATEPVQPGEAAGRRGVANKDGAPCAAVGYTFDNTILDNNTVAFSWNTGNGQQGAAFEYTMVWKPEYVNATTGMPERVTTVKWTGLTSPVPARACLSASLPGDYGTLNGAIGSGDLSITITPGSLAPLAGPFPIVIGNERLLVTDTSGGNTWVVTRGTGGTTAAGHADLAKVMSTPLPLDGSGNQMQMCIVAEGWVSAPAGGTDTDCVVPDPAPGSNPPRACVLFKTTIFDMGDGVVSRGSGGN